MPYPLRSTVGAAVLAGALVFSGTAANAQPVETDESVASAPVGQGTPGAGDSTPVVDLGEAPVPPAPPVDGTGDEAPGAQSPDAGTPGDDAATGQAGDEEQPSAGSGEEGGTTLPSTEDLPADTEEAPGEEAPEEVPAGTIDETLVEEGLPLTEEVAPLTGAEAPSSTDGISLPAAEVVPVADTEVAAEIAATTEEKAGADAKADAPLPVSGVIEFPEGAADWTDGQWKDWQGSDEFIQWLGDNNDAIVELIDSREFAEFGDSIFDYFVEEDPEGLLAYLEANFPDDPLMAQFMVGLVMGQLMEDGLLDEDGNFIGELVPEDEEPAEKPHKEPAEDTDGETVIEPVANITKPKASTTKPVEVITPIKVPAQGLAETGAEGIGLLAGAGGGMLVLGMGALALRRRKQA